MVLTSALACHENTKQQAPANMIKDKLLCMRITTKSNRFTKNLLKFPFRTYRIDRDLRRVSTVIEFGKIIETRKFFLSESGAQTLPRTQDYCGTIFPQRS